MKNKNKEEMPVEVEIEVSKEEKEDGEIPQHEIEMALEDFLRVAKHKANKKLMAAISSKAEEKKKAIESIDDLKKIRNEMFTKES